MSAREAILARVRGAIAPAHVDGAAEIPRAYRMHIDADIDTFLSRLHHYDARARQVTEQELDATVRAALAERGAQRLVAPDGIPDPWLEGLEPLRDDPPLDPHALDQSDGLISTCAVAIAETGTIVLDASAGMGRRVLSLVPDYHLCVVRSDQIVGSVPEAIDRLDPVRPLTFISGPSATVDIELVRVGGVHGPRTLEVIIAAG
ncbi:MAG: LUD domain-containing protein [Candidatus Dormibacteraeota bacterium]|nr:LUD domain-containing protein [Candidatus Dormibacteraeota bacterium]